MQRHKFVRHLIITDFNKLNIAMYDLEVSRRVNSMNSSRAISRIRDLISDPWWWESRWSSKVGFIQTPDVIIALEKLVVVKLVKKFAALYENQRLISIFTIAHHCTQSWTRCILPITSYSVPLWSILILSSRLCLVSRNISLPSRFSDESSECVCRLSYICAFRAHLTLLNLITLIIVSEEYRL
jgi:hypothetical protein